MYETINYVKSRRKYRDTMAAMQQAIKRVTLAAKRLTTNENLPGASVESLADFKPSWLESAINAHTDTIKASRVLTAAERAERLQFWRNLKKTALSDINAIQSVLRDWPELSWVRSGETGFFVQTADLEEIAEKRSTVEVPALAHEHLNRVNGILEDIADLREWEHQNKLTHYRLDVLQSFSVYDFCLRHAEGEFSDNLGPVGERYRQPVSLDAIKRII